jgi:hypothetical protein
MSRQRNIRKKSVLLSFDGDEDEAGDEGASVALPPAAQAAKAAKEKQRKAEKKSLLSFEEDGGGHDGGSSRGVPVKSTSSNQRGSLRAPGTVTPLAAAADERAQRVNTQMSSAGRLRQFQGSATRVEARATMHHPLVMGIHTTSTST